MILVDDVVSDAGKGFCINVTAKMNFNHAIVSTLVNTMMDKFMAGESKESVCESKVSLINY